MNTHELLNRVGEHLSVRRAFGAPYEKGELLVVPVALVAGGGVTHDSEKDPPPPADGGFGGLILPMGVYVVKGDEVRWRPALDVPLLILTGFGVLRLLIRSRTRVRLRQRHKKT